MLIVSQSQKEAFEKAGYDTSEIVVNKPVPRTQDVGTCETCGAELMPIWENNGFNPPDPTHWEITGYEQCGNCSEGE